jgi:hypothetical protein
MAWAPSPDRCDSPHRVNSSRVPEAVRDGRHRIPARELAIAAAVFLGLTVAVTWPTARHLSTAIYGGYGDSVAWAHFVWWQAHDHWQIFGTTHISLWGAPFGFRQDYALFLNQQLVLIPGTLLTYLVGPVVAYNLIVLSGLALSGLAMYAFARYLGASPPVAFWGGLVFTIFPWHLAQSGHVGMVHLWSFPLIGLAGLWWWMEPSLRRALPMGGLLAIQLLIDPYIGFISVFLVGVVLVVGVVHQYRNAHRRSALLALRGGLLGTMWAPLLIYGYLLYDSATVKSPELTARKTMDISQVTVWAARWYELLVPTAANPILGRLINQWYVPPLHGSDLAESSLFLGYLTIALAIGYCVSAARNSTSLRPIERYAIGIALVGLATGLLMALAQSHTLAGLTIPSPGAILFHLAPYWRVYSRFATLVLFSLLVLAILGLERLVSRYTTPTRWAIVLVACGLSAAELYTHVPIDSTTPLTARYGPLTKIAPGTILAEYPLVPASHADPSVYLFGQTIHRHPLLNSAPEGDTGDVLRHDLTALNGPLVPQMLAFAGVGLVAVNGAALPPIAGLAPMPRASSANFHVYDVTARPTDGIALFVGGVQPTTPPDNSVAPATVPEYGAFGGPTWSVVSSVLTTRIWVRHSGTYTIAFRAQSLTEPQRLTIQIPAASPRIASVGTQPTAVQFTVPLTSGLNPLQITIQQAPGPSDTAQAQPGINIAMTNWRITQTR